MSGFEFKALPNKEAIAYFRAKGYAPAISRFSWKDVWADEHDRMFTVAKAMREDVLKAIRNELDDAIANGRTIEQFREALQSKLEAFGWWGKETQTDPKTGEIAEVQLGSPRRLQIIYDTNLRTANAAGRWKRAQRNKRLMPFFTYIQIDRDNKREAHKPFDGVTLPVDHPFWKTHWPPNGWQCGCIVRQISKRVMERDGLSATPDTEIDKVSETRPYFNERTGRTEQIPKGIDPSFERNAGMARFNADSTSPPSEPRTPKPARVSDPFSSKKKEGAALRQAYSAAPDYITDAIRAMPSLDGLTHRKHRGAVYQRKITSTGMVRSIDMNKLTKGSPEYHAVLRHEYGHAMDYEAGGLRASVSVRSLEVIQSEGAELVKSAGKDAFVAARKALQTRIENGDIAQGLAKEAARFDIDLDDLRQLLGNEAFESKALDLFAALDSRNVRVLFDKSGLLPAGPSEDAQAMLHDLIGAVTGNKLRFRWGHSDSYYRKRGAVRSRLGEGNAAEAFANWVSIIADPNPAYGAILRALVPNMHKAYIQEMSDFANRKKL